MQQKANKFDLEERTAFFGETIIDVCRSVPKNTLTLPMRNQILRSGTSIGANYCEANNASSKKDFRNKIFICKKEAQETKYWLRMLAHACTEKKEEMRIVWKENQELALIFQKIINSSK